MSDGFAVISGYFQRCWGIAASNPSNKLSIESHDELIGRLSAN